MTSDERQYPLPFWLGDWSDKRYYNGRYIDGEKKKWKPNTQAVAISIAFAKERGSMEMD